MLKLDRYIVAAIAMGCLIAAVILVGLSAVMAFFQEAGIFGGSKDVDLLYAFQIAVLGIPQRVQDLMPASVLLGTLLGLGGLAAGSELTAMRAYGMSLKRMALATVQAGLLFGLLALLVGDFVVPGSNQLADQIRYNANANGASTNVGKGSIWLRERQRYIHIGAIYTPRSLGNINIYSYSEDGRLNGQLGAERAEFDGEHWRMYAVRITRFNDQNVSASTYPYMDWQVTLDPKLLRISMKASTKMSTLGLWRYANYLQSNGLDASLYWWYLWRKFTLPFTVMVMALLALPFVLGSQRSSGTARRMFMGVLLGLGFYMANDIVSRSGEVYGLPAWLSVSLVTLAAGSMAVLLLRRIR